MRYNNSQNSYRSILRGTSIFGGVQVLQVLINLVRGKFVALILGPEGMGISSLFSASSNTIQRFASLGVNLAIVREVSQKSDESDTFNSTMAVISRLLMITSLLGACICAFFCVPLSRATFGTPNMAWQFVLLGVAVAFGIAGAGKLSILQGLHEVKRLSMSSLVGGLGGLLMGVPMYYFFGNKGIVPAMAALSLTMYIFYSVSLRKATQHVSGKIKFSWQEHSYIVKRLIQLGLLMMASDLIGSGVNYLINIFIRYYSDYATVGLYQAANSITNQYAGMVFTAMAMDYFPRLSKACGENDLMRTIVNRQAEIVALIIAPAMILLIATAPLIIRILLTSEFQPVLELMRWFGLGVLMKAFSYPMGYISLAKANKKVFFWLEGVTGNLLTLGLSCIMYYIFGLIGLGYAIVVDNGLCIVIYYIVNRRLYGFGFTQASLRQMGVAVVLVGACFTCSYIENTVAAWIAMSLTLVISAIYSFVQIKKFIKEA